MRRAACVRREGDGVLILDGLFIFSRLAMQLEFVGKERVLRIGDIVSRKREAEWQIWRGVRVR